ncbi:hypothetical protein ACS0TY_033706 [Phlomoides rotata]
MVFLSILALVIITLFPFASAFDATPIQDLCVADRGASSVIVNGVPCKDISLIEADDFVFHGLHEPGNTDNPFGASLTTASVDSVSGLNTLGMALARLDFKPTGFIPPHVHPRATEIIIVLEGSMEVGFVTSYPEYKHFGPKVLEKGDTFVIPVGLLHYQRQVGTQNTSAISVVNSQNPGIVAITNELFAASPHIDGGYLSTVLSVDQEIIENIQLNYPSTRIV